MTGRTITTPQAPQRKGTPSPAIPAAEWLLAPPASREELLAVMRPGGCRRRWHRCCMGAASPRRCWTHRWP